MSPGLEEPPGLRGLDEEEVKEPFTFCSPPPWCHQNTSSASVPEIPGFLGFLFDVFWFTGPAPVER